MKVFVLFEEFDPYAGERFIDVYDSLEKAEKVVYGFNPKPRKICEYSLNVGEESPCTGYSYHQFSVHDSNRKICEYDIIEVNVK
jgi:hypothetical protein